MAYTKNTLFNSSGIICRSPPPSLLPNDLSMDERDSDNFFSMQRVHTTSRITPIIRPTHHSSELPWSWFERMLITVLNVGDTVFMVVSST